MQRYVGKITSTIFMAWFVSMAGQPVLAQEVPQDPVMRLYYQQLQAQAPYFNTPIAGAPQAYRPQPIDASAPTEQPVSGSAIGGTPYAPLWGYVSELRFGVLSHDIKFPSRHKMHMPNPFANRYEGGVNLNPEVVFISPDFLDVIYAPRLHLGATLNTAGDTSSLYGGLNWDTAWDNGVFLEGFWGLAIHDGVLRGGNPKSIDFGSPVLFRLGGEAGWRWDDNQGVSLIWEHMSHADMFSNKNQGIDSLGLRYSYRFDH